MNLSSVDIAHVTYFSLLQEGIFFQLGQLVAMVVVQGGSGLHIFSPSVYICMSGTCAMADIIVDNEEVPEQDVRELITKVLNPN